MPLHQTLSTGRSRVLDDRTTVIRLFDVYAGVLTARRRALLRMYYHEDLSFGEIAERLRVTRQAVFDSLRRAVGEMRRLDDRLGLLAGPGRGPARGSRRPPRAGRDRSPRTRPAASAEHAPSDRHIRLAAVEREVKRLTASGVETREIVRALRALREVV